MRRDMQFRAVDEWALASDGVQWVLHRERGGMWHALSFARAKATLARCMATRGVPRDIADLLLDGLPDSFEAEAA